MRNMLDHVISLPMHRLGFHAHVSSLLGIMIILVYHGITRNSLTPKVVKSGVPKSGHHQIWTPSWCLHHTIFTRSSLVTSSSQHHHILSTPHGVIQGIWYKAYYYMYCAMQMISSGDHMRSRGDKRFASADLVCARLCFRRFGLPTAVVRRRSLRSHRYANACCPLSPMR